MATYCGGQVVKGGYYLNQSTWEFEVVGEGGGILASDGGTCYARLPVPTVMVAGSLTALAYVILLPIGFCFASGYFLVSRATKALKRL